MNPVTHSKQFIQKFLVVSAVTFLLGLASHASAQGFVPLAPIPGLTEGGAANSSNLAEFFNNLYKYLIGLAAVLAVIEIIWGGLEISTQDSVSKQQDGKERIRQAIFGLVLVLSPVLVFSIINPSILNLSLNLQKLDLATPQQYQIKTFGQDAIPPGLNKTGSVTGQQSVPAPSGMSGSTQKNTYTDSASIPQGQWCYQQSVSFICSPQQSNCDSLYQYALLQGAATASCKLY